MQSSLDHGNLPHFCHKWPKLVDTNTKKARFLGLLFSNGGAEGDRTLDLLHAMEALSQLSYSPIGIPETFSGEVNSTLFGNVSQ